MSSREAPEDAAMNTNNLLMYAAWAALAGALTNAQAYRHVGLKGVDTPPPNVSRETSAPE